MKYILLAIALASCTFTASADLSIDFNIGSKHAKSSDPSLNKKYNEVNLGLGLTKQTSEHLFVTGGFYKNSLSKTSYYIGGGLNYSLVDTSSIDVQVGVVGGLVTGYSVNIAPMLAPTVAIGIDDVRLQMRFIPEIKGITPAVVGFSIQVDLD